jgi:hypothetical protein
VLGLPHTGFGALADFSLKVMVGVFTYLACLLGLWRAAHAPEGPERLAFDALKRLRLRKRAAPV